MCKLKAFLFIALLSSLHIHTARVKLQVAQIGDNMKRRPSSTHGSHAAAGAIDLEDGAELVEVLQSMTVEELSDLLTTENPQYTETPPRGVFRVDENPGGQWSLGTPQWYHYKNCRYTLTFGQNGNFLNLYYGLAGRMDHPHRTMQLFEDSQIILRKGKFGPSVIVSGADTRFQNKSGQHRVSWKFRLLRDGVSSKLMEPRTVEVHSDSRNDSTEAHSVQAFQQLIADLQSAISATTADPPLVACTLRDLGDCFPKHVCERQYDWRIKASEMAVCHAVRGDARMADTWNALLAEMSSTSQMLLDSNCFRTCMDSWFFLTSHLEVARTVINGMEEFDPQRYPAVLDALKKSEEVVSKINEQLIKAFDALPGTEKNHKNCKLTAKLAPILEHMRGTDSVEVESHQDTLKRFASHCPELANQIGQTLDAIRQQQQQESETTSIATNSTNPILLEIASSNKTPTSSLASSSFLEGSLGSGEITIAMLTVVASVVALMLVAVVISYVAALVSYLIVRFLVWVLCAGISKAFSPESRKQFNKKCNRMGRYAAFGAAALIGIGSVLIIGFPVVGAFGLGGMVSYLVGHVVFSTSSLAAIRIRKQILRRRKERTSREIERERMVDWQDENDGICYPWKRIFSDERGKYWYLNVETKKKSWDKPRSVDLPKLYKPWIKMWSETQDQYWYVNTKTKDRSWKHPVEV